VFAILTVVLSDVVVQETALERLGFSPTAGNVIMAPRACLQKSYSSRNLSVLRLLLIVLLEI
jgi:hypothetical protein